ncbi:MAG: phosphoglycolate phosphatase [Woeseiaceae bacterium]|jgi:phosphoglycolate phosphatase
MIHLRSLIVIRDRRPYRNRNAASSHVEPARHIVRINILTCADIDIYSAAVTYETLIFDLDGTISDPFVGISRSVNFALESLQFAAADPEAIRPMIGPPLSEIFEHLLGPLSQEVTHDLIDKYRERYTLVGYAENQIYEEIPEIIGQLSALGYKLGVCTAKRADYARKIVEHFDLDPHFSFVDGGGTNVHKTAQLERIIASGVDSRTAVMIGDRAGDIRAAHANKISSVGVLWGFGDHDELSQVKPDYMAATPPQLQAIFV